MTQAFYAMLLARRVAFRNAVGAVRHGRSPTQEFAFNLLDVDRETIERTHTLQLHALVADRLALTPEPGRAPIERVLFGGSAS
ncbi:hypothetical protein [Methylobacterium pseudosasicola]|uniref:Uncharacterized protein n=1 Tax=Methylobacterium pseudosasicola TaxID=582667 RepID=A0A1I4QM83_9HYPH|nr:hypothetical protein [Methylobacterium pseudosasicola]SFM41124.1 hypothetical protein SAMN05192568_103061 [Methylobacterium pseudosasicola]